MGVQEIVLDLVNRQNERAKGPVRIIPPRFVCGTEVPIRQSKDVRKTRLLSILHDRSNSLVSASHQEEHAGIIPEGRKVLTGQRIFDPQVDRASIKTRSRHVSRHARPKTSVIYYP